MLLMYIETDITPKTYGPVEEELWSLTAFFLLFFLFDVLPFRSGFPPVLFRHHVACRNRSPSRVIKIRTEQEFLNCCLRTPPHSQVSFPIIKTVFQHAIHTSNPRQRSTLTHFINGQG